MREKICNLKKGICYFSSALVFFAAAMVPLIGFRLVLLRLLLFATLLSYQGTFSAPNDFFPVSEAGRLE